MVPLRWSESFGAVSYGVKRAVKPEGPFRRLATVSNPSYLDREIEPGKTYYYAVSAANAAGASADSPAASATPIGRAEKVLEPAPAGKL